MKKPKKPQSAVAAPLAWKPDPQDAISLAALRWYACTIERFCIEIYATDRRRFEDLENLLKSQVAALIKFSKQLQATDDDDCPPGFMMCRDGLCAPACEYDPMS